MCVCVCLKYSSRLLCVNLCDFRKKKVEVWTITGYWSHPWIPQTLNTINPSDVFKIKKSKHVTCLLPPGVRMYPSSNVIKVLACGECLLSFLSLADSKTSGRFFSFAFFLFCFFFSFPNHCTGRTFNKYAPF